MMEPNIKAWMIDRIKEIQSRRDWGILPQDYEYLAVKQAFGIIKPHFDKRDIKIRIDASRCQTFEELLRIIIAWS